MVFLVTCLANYGMHHSLEDVFLRQDAFHVFDELICLVYIVILQVVNDQVEAGLRDDID